MHGPQQGRAEEALAHGGAAGVHGAEEGNVGSGLGEERLDELEIARGDLVEVEVLGAPVEAEGVDVGRVGVLGAADVVDDGAGGDGGGGVSGEAEALEGLAAKLAFEEGQGEVGGENPVVDGGAGFDLSEERLESGGVGFGAKGTGGGGEDELGGGDAEEFFKDLGDGAGSGKFGGAEVAGGEVEEGETGGVAGDVDCGEVIGLLGGESGIEGGSGGENAGDFAADDLFGELWVLHLLADGDAVALAKKPGDVVVRGVPGDAAHGRVALLVARGEGELQLAGGGFGVVEEELVEVAEAEEEQGVGVLALGGQILAHERGLGFDGVVGH